MKPEIETPGQREERLADFDGNPVTRWGWGVLIGAILGVVLILLMVFA